MTNPKIFKIAAIGLFTFVISCQSKKSTDNELSAKKDKPLNVLILMADQWRAQATGYAGDPNVKTPHLDRLAGESANFTNAVAGMPVCCPQRASMMTGQRPLTHGVFMNDVPLDTQAVTMGKIFTKAGYDTGYIGKWHLDGQGRLQYIPPGNRRQGFQYWKANECTHNYNHSVYYTHFGPQRKIWKGYDAIAQTEDAIGFIKARTDEDRPFLLFLSWGTPHAPYHTAPDEYRSLYDSADMVLRPNVPTDMKGRAKKDLAGYYAHATALDDMIGKLRVVLEETALADNTIVLFTSDHGDLLGSQGAYKKQQPYDESIRVPMLYYVPERNNNSAGPLEALMNSEDILPTLLGLCDIPIPGTTEGIDYSRYIKGGENPGDTATLITCVQPFGQWNRVQHGGKEYRGVRTLRYTYTRDLEGPWLLFDNEKDPYQLNNLVGNPEFAALQAGLDQLLLKKLNDTNDEFLSGPEYIAQWGYPIDETGTVPYTH